MTNRNFGGIMIHDLSGKEKSALLGAAKIALGLMGEENHGLDAAGKKHCGMCANKAAGKSVWLCRHVEVFKCPYTAIGRCPGFQRKSSTPRPPQPKKKGLPVPPGVTFLYFGQPELGFREHQGVVTVAWITPAPGILHLGFAFCSPEDPWCKATGRNIAMARLLHHPVVIPFLYSSKRTVHEVVRAMLTHDFRRIAAIAPGVTMFGAVPSWTKGLGKRMGAGIERRSWVHPRIAQLFLDNQAVAKAIPNVAQILVEMMVDFAKLGRAAD